MKNTRKTSIGWPETALAALLLLAAGMGCGKSGIENGFEYQSGTLSSELLGVVPNDAAPPEARLEVPKKLGGKHVVSVAPRAFCPCTNVVSVKIPRRVSRIGAEAFSGCKNLVWAELPNRLERVEDGLFRNCRKMTDSVLPPRVKEIGAQAYAGCVQLNRVVFPAKLRSVGAYAFSGCHSLDQLELPQGIDNIPDGAFEGCIGLSSIRLPEGVTNIGARAFAGCTSLTEIALPAGLRSIGEEAFAGCEKLVRMELPASLETLGGGTFAGCTRLRDFSVHADNAQFRFEDGALLTMDGQTLLGCPVEAGGTFRVPEGVREVADGAFEQCGWLESVFLPASVERLGAKAFAECGGLKTVELPAGLLSMGRECFRETGLERVAVPSGVASLEEGVFFDCGSLEQIELVPGLEAVREKAIRRCPRLTEVRLPATVRDVQPSAFLDCPSLSAVEVAEGNPVFSSRDGVLFRDGGMELVCCPGARSGAYAVPADVKRIGPGAFRASSVEKVAVPDGVETIGESAFRDCRRLRQVALGDGVAEIGEAAFMGCSALWKCVLPGNVRRTGDALFAGCDGLMLLAVPDGLMAETLPDAWKVPDDCALLSRSEWDGKRPSDMACDPFFGLYADEDLDTVSFEGTVLAASAIPDPESNDYDHCLYALLVELDSVFSATPLSTNVPRVVLVNAPIMRDRVVVRTNEFVPGDKVFCMCAEYDAMPQEILEIQLSDDILSFEHQPYYPLKIRKIAYFRNTGNKDFAKREITVLPIQSLPRDAHATAARRERIQSEIRRVESELEKHGGSFEAWRKEYRPIAEKWLRLCEENYAAWSGDSYFAAGGPETAYQTQEYIESLLPYKKFLEENNIDLIVVRIPTKWDFAARVLTADDFQENPVWMEHYYECLKHDIEIVDPMPEMWKERFEFPLFYFYTALKEFHPFEGASFVMAKEIAKVLERYPFQRDGTGITLEDAAFETTQPCFYWPEGNEKFDPGQIMAFKQVVQDGSPIGNLTASSGSPFIFLSNSFFWYPQRPLGASVPGYTAYFIQAIPDWFYQDGAHGHLLKSLCSRQQLLNGRRAVVMVGDSKTWRAFPPIPKYIQDHARRITLEKTLAPSSDEITIGNPDSFACSFDGSGNLLVVADGAHPAKKAKNFEMDFEVPCMEGFHACMIRVNFAEVSHVELSLKDDRSEDILDTSFLAPGRNQSADLCVPLSTSNARVKLVFRTYHPERACIVKNIEFWYY